MNTKLIFHPPKIWMFIVKPVFLLRGVRERKETVLFIEQLLLVGAG